MKYIAGIFLICLFILPVFAEEKVFYADGPKNEKKVAFTFDDGPGTATEEILNILKEKNIKATFFLLGVHIVKNPKLSKMIVDAGHEIANHTYGHYNFYSYKEADKKEKIEKELIKNHDLIKENLGVKPFLVRFPHGYARQDAINIAGKNDYYIINWSFGCDWEKLSAEDMHKKYLGALRNGTIYLMHDGWNNTKLISFLSDFIDNIREEGYEIVPVGELLGLKKKKGKYNQEAK